MGFLRTKVFWVILLALVGVGGLILLAAIGRLAGETAAASIAGIIAGFVTGKVGNNSVKGILVLVCCGGLFLGSGGCASTMQGNLVDAHSAVDVVSKAALKTFHVECRARAKQCKKDGVQKALNCAKWRECDNARESFRSAIKLAEDGLMAINQAYTNAKDSGILK